MHHGIVSSHRWLIFPLVIAVMGCNKALDQHQGPTAEATVDESSQQAYRQDQRNALRTRTDPARGRIWVLGIDDVRVYDAASRRLLRQIALPGWLVVDTPCMPDLILHRSGSAYISSNVRPWIWRIDGAGFDLRVYEVSMPGREHLDFGFATLRFGDNGTLYAFSPAANSVWKIDLFHANASMIESYGVPLNECTLAMQSPDRLEGSAWDSTYRATHLLERKRP